MSDFDGSQIVAYRNCGLLHQNITVCVSQDLKTIWNMKSVISERSHGNRAESQWPAEDRYFNCMALTDRIATSWTLSLRNEVFCKAAIVDMNSSSTFTEAWSVKLGNHGFRYPWRYITDRRVLNGAFNNEPGRVTWCLYPCFTASWRTHVEKVHSTSSY